MAEPETSPNPPAVAGGDAVAPDGASNPTPGEDGAAEPLSVPHVACIVIGMAGAGKTTLMHRMTTYLASDEIASPAYVINLDPAVVHMPYETNIDVRDTVNYKKVMSDYNLGPNGGILTALNLFATRFDQVIGFAEKRVEEDGVEYILVDTPGQIEIFTWSASGSIIAESLGVSFPTCVLYVVDTPRTTAPSTFMSNMLYACSILYKTQLPFVLVFNKADVTSADFAETWMTDFEAFADAVSDENTISSDLIRSMSLTLEEFYSTLRHVAVSAVTGEGMDDLFVAIQEAGLEYEREFRPELERRRAARAAADEQSQEDMLQDLRADVEASGGMTAVLDARTGGGSGGDVLPGDEPDGAVEAVSDED